MVIKINSTIGIYKYWRIIDKKYKCIKIYMFGVYKNINSKIIVKL